MLGIFYQVVVSNKISPVIWNVVLVDKAHIPVYSLWNRGLLKVLINTKIFLNERNLFDHCNAPQLIKKSIQSYYRIKRLVDNIYFLWIVECDAAQKCNGHGICGTDGLCECDWGFFLEDCSSNLKETFQLF